MFKAYPGVIVLENLIESLAAAGEADCAYLAHTHAMAKAGARKLELFAVAPDVESRAADSPGAETRGQHRTQLFAAACRHKFAIDDDTHGPTSDVALNHVDPIKPGAHTGAGVTVERVSQSIERDVELPPIMYTLGRVGNPEQVRWRRSAPDNAGVARGTAAVLVVKRLDRPPFVGEDDAAGFNGCRPGDPLKSGGECLRRAIELAVRFRAEVEVFSVVAAEVGDGIGTSQHCLEAGDGAYGVCRDGAERRLRQY